MTRHFNKYEAEAKLAQRKRVEERMCKRKTGYASRADAATPGQHVYECPFCYLWHRSASLITEVRRASRRPRHDA